MIEVLQKEVKANAWVIDEQQALQPGQLVTSLVVGQGSNWLSLLLTSVGMRVYTH
jgi:hypothetical protein